MKSNGQGGVLAICMEVATPEFILAGLEKGWMPELDRIRREGVWCALESLADISSGAIWPSVSTGVGPATHGQFFTHMQIEPGTYRIVKKYANDVPCDPFWLELHRAGKASAIIDVPQSRPVEGFKGLHIVGWGGEFAAWKRCSSPPSLMPEVLREFGPHPLANKYRLHVIPETKEDYERLEGHLVHGAHTKARLSCWIQDRGPFDLLFTVFSEPHWAMHLLWDTLDESHPHHNPELAQRYADTFRRVYGEIDRCIGELRASQPEADVLVFSLSGMGPNYSGWHVLGEFLDRLGMGAGERRPALAGFFPLGRWGARTTRVVEELVSLRALEALKSVVPERLWADWTRRLLFAGNAWRQSRAFWVPNDFIGAIRVNLRGREPDGRVAEGEEYDAVCALIVEALMELENADTGRPLVRKVLKTREEMTGSRLDVLPDLLVIWETDAPVEAVRSPRLGAFRCEDPERRTGAHRNTGFLAGTGPGLASQGPVSGGRVLDLAPTLLHLCGVPVPQAYEGQVLTQILADPS